MLAFVKHEPAKAASLVAAIQKLTEEHKAKNLQAFVVFQGGPELKEPIEKLAAEKGIRVPMTFLPQGPSASDIAKWKISPEAGTTILVYNKRKVHGNFVNVNRETWAEVVKSTASMLAE